MGFMRKARPQVPRFEHLERWECHQLRWGMLNEVSCFLGGVRLACQFGPGDVGLSSWQLDRRVSNLEESSGLGYTFGQPQQLDGA